MQATTLAVTGAAPIWRDGARSTSMAPKSAQERQAVPAKDCAPVAVAHVVTPTSTGKRSMITSMKSGLTKMTAAFAIKSKAALGKKDEGQCAKHSNTIGVGVGTGVEELLSPLLPQTRSGANTYKLLQNTSPQQRYGRGTSRGTPLESQLGIIREHSPVKSSREPYTASNGRDGWQPVALAPLAGASRDLAPTSNWQQGRAKTSPSLLTSYDWCVRDLEKLAGYEAYEHILYNAKNRVGQRWRIFSPDRSAREPLVVDVHTPQSLHDAGKVLWPREIAEMVERIARIMQKHLFEELPADGFKVVTGRENHPGQGVFTAVWNRLEALRMRGNLIRSLRADRLNPNNPQEQPASLQVKLLRLYPTTRTTTRQA